MNIVINYQKTQHTQIPIYKTNSNFYLLTSIILCITSFLYKYYEEIDVMISIII